ncbi:hypothetical protein D9M68_608460 [compost metagenome]
MVPMPPMITMNIAVTTQLMSKAESGETNIVPMKCAPPASPKPSPDSTNAMKRVRHTFTPMLVAASSLSRTAISPRPKGERISRYTPATAARPMAPEIQNAFCWKVSASTSRTACSGTPDSPPNSGNLATRSRTISASTHMPIEK